MNLEKLKILTQTEMAIMQEIVSIQTKPLLEKISNLEREVVILAEQNRVITKSLSLAGELLYGKNKPGNNAKTGGADQQEKHDS